MTEQPGKSEGLVWVVIGGLICVFAFRVNLGTFVEPGPGFVAFASGLFLIAIGLVMFFTRAVLRKTGAAASGPKDLTSLIPGPRFLYTVVLLIVYVLLLNGVGYILTTFVVMWGLFFDRGKNSLIFSTVTSLAVTLITYVVFEVWLHSQFPRGILPWW
jgi:putative tricarboxylic transport membrane protein